jgi:hypothetical protein
MGGTNPNRPGASRERKRFIRQKSNHTWDLLQQMKKSTSKKAKRSGKNFVQSACMHDAVEHQKTQQPKNWQQKNFRHF